MKIAIVIPVYKNPDKWEMISLQQCCKVLGNYHMILVTPKHFDTNEYQSLWTSYGLSLYEERFDDAYFADIQGYNRLLLSQEFYSRFQKHDYILIYQPDAYVFSDKLTEWCKKGYDYVGAPLIGKFEENEYYPEMPVRVGNGGFSLRRVQAYMDYFEGKKNVFTAKQIVDRISMWKKPYTRVFVWIMMLLGWRNKPFTVARNWKYNEDDFWSGVLDGTRYALSKPSPDEALGFAWERFPSACLAERERERRREALLPFGCHAWRKYEYENFWKEIIGDESSCNLIFGYSGRSSKSCLPHTECNKCSR